MVIDENSRHELHNRLAEVLGSNHAGVLMEHLPPVGWADVATKKDIEYLRAATKSDIESLKVDIETLRTTTQKDMDSLKYELLATFRQEANTQTRTFVTTVLWSNAAAVLTVAGIAFAAARLI